MALFEPAFNELIKHEGGYVNDPDDHGGETYRGISRKNWPGWNGWADVDKIKSGHPQVGAIHELPLQKALNSNADLQGRVKEFYRRNFWMPPMEAMSDQALANWLFDKAVNMGVRQAYKLMQRAVHVDEDGVIGLQTMRGINAADPVQLLADCRDQAKRFYVNLALHDPSQTRFLNGWLARA
jgi:lysozyme family protein